MNITRRHFASQILRSVAVLGLAVGLGLGNALGIAPRQRGAWIETVSLRSGARGLWLHRPPATGGVD